MSPRRSKKDQIAEEMFEESLNFGEQFHENFDENAGGFDKEYAPSNNHYEEESGLRVEYKVVDVAQEENVGFNGERETAEGEAPDDDSQESEDREESAEPTSEEGEGRRGRRQRRRSVNVETKAPSAPLTEQSEQGGQNGVAEQTGKNAQNAQNGQNGQNGQNPQNHQKSNRNQQQNTRVQRQARHQHNAQKEIVPTLTKEMLEEESIEDLLARAEVFKISVFGMDRDDLITAIVDASAKAEGFVEVEGILDILQEGFGFLRTAGYLPSEGDAYVSLPMIRKNGLRRGDYIKGVIRPARQLDKYAALQKITLVNDVPVEEIGNRPKFSDLTPIYPDQRLIMEHGKDALTARVIDLVAPIGKGQRGLIVSPPKAGKTTILKDIAAAIHANNPEVHLMCLLVDERPEEVTDMERSIHGEVISSTFDMPCENHIAVAELVIERAKRLVENGMDVVILLDSITRLARAYNLGTPASGRILSGGVDSSALYPPKRFLGAARNIENGGSLTILASALIDTGSKMDEVIFEEFKGTGNMELRLDRDLADRRIFPAIDPIVSGTRKEDLLLEPKFEAPLVWGLRQLLANYNNTERAMSVLIKAMKQADSNMEFLLLSAKKAQLSKSDSELEM